MLANLTGVAEGLFESALTMNAALSPNVVLDENVTPRGLLALKKSAGRKLGAEKLSGTPSQLISRRPDVNDPPTPLLEPPRSVRNWSTVLCMAAAFAPDAVLVTGDANNAVVLASKIAAAEIITNVFTF